ncbi:hypothetical protein H2203_001000 [Taxawa tesnikishii (nom. ined.)]|nr:hypothetical protein H2203_001000 [Dothideales sp. JES 119]
MTSNQWLGSSLNTSHETLPPYQESQSKDIIVTEKEVPANAATQPHHQSKLSTLKSILSGDARRHSSAYRVPERAAHASSADEEGSGSGTSTRSRSGTLKSIFSGSVHKHNPYSVLERAADASAASR